MSPQAYVSSPSELRLLPLLVVIVVLILTLFGTLTCVCVWRRGRKLAGKWRVPRTRCLTLLPAPGGRVHVSGGKQ